MDPQPLIRIAIADDHPVTRRGIIDTIALFDGFSIDIEADNGEDLIMQLEQAVEMPDICILDISMPGLNGYETLKEIKRRWPHVKVLVFSMYNNEFSVMKMLKEGANGYLQKNCPPRQLQRALADIYYNGIYNAELAAPQLIKLLHHKDALPDITDREMEFLQHCCSELTYKEIAGLMHLSTRTVEGYRDALFNKLNIKTRTGLVMYAVRNGIVSHKDNSC